MHCEKYDLQVTSCSRQTAIFSPEICDDCSQEETKEISTLLSPEDIPFINRWSNFRIIAAAAYPKKKGKEYICVRCKQIYFDNINPNRDILCHQCTLDLAMGCERQLLTLKQEEQGDIATFRTSAHKIIHKRLLGRVKTLCHK